MEMFEQASRIKLTFPTSKGEITVDDLWDLPLKSTTGKLNLDDIARGLHKKLEGSETISFVDDEKSTDPTHQLRFNIVKRVIEVKKAENKAAADEKERAEKKQQILSLIAQKRNEALAGKSEDELTALLANL